MLHCVGPWSLPQWCWPRFQLSFMGSRLWLHTLGSVKQGLGVQFPLSSCFWSSGCATGSQVTYYVGGRHWCRQILAPKTLSWLKLLSKLSQNQVQITASWQSANKTTLAVAQWPSGSAWLMGGGGGGRDWIMYRFKTFFFFFKNNNNLKQEWLPMHQNKIQTHRRLKRMLFIRTKDSMQILGVIPFFKL